MDFRYNDHWVASFRVEKLGRYQYTVRGWTDPFLTWKRDLKKRQEAGQDLTIDLQIGSQLLGSEIEDFDAAMAAELPPPVEDRTATFDKILEVVVDPVRARFSSWYELFPRSFGGFKGMLERAAVRREARLQRALPAAGASDRHHRAQRKEQRRRRASRAMSAARGRSARSEGGHKALHPGAGLDGGFPHPGARSRRPRTCRSRSTSPSSARRTIRTCSSHPEWFRWRPDGTVQYAENPPKKYQDIYPFEFESEAWKSLWEELKSVFEFWIAHGVTIFRVDNPHTKPFEFWEWCIAELKKKHPEVIFLSEAFTRPRIMHKLAKLGFTQSYTYFTWRNTKAELTEYFTELTSSESRASTSGPTSGRTRPTSCTRRCSTAAGRRSSCARCWRRRWRRTTASTARPTSCRSARRASRAARSTSTRRSTRSRTGTCSAPTASRRCWRGSIPSGTRIRRCNRTGASSSTRSTTTS